MPETTFKKNIRYINSDSINDVLIIKASTLLEFLSNNKQLFSFSNYEVIEPLIELLKNNNSNYGVCKINSFVNFKDNSLINNINIFTDTFTSNQLYGLNFSLSPNSEIINLEIENKNRDSIIKHLRARSIGNFYTFDDPFYDMNHTDLHKYNTDECHNLIKFFHRLTFFDISSFVIGADIRCLNSLFEVIVHPNEKFYNVYKSSKFSTIEKEINIQISQIIGNVLYMDYPIIKKSDIELNMYLNLNEFTNDTDIIITDKKDIPVKMEYQSYGKDYIPFFTFDKSSMSFRKVRKFISQLVAGFNNKSRTYLPLYCIKFKATSLINVKDTVIVIKEDKFCPSLRLNDILEVNEIYDLRSNNVVKLYCAKKDCYFTTSIKNVKLYETKNK
jgi:hypothetical protein